MYGVIFASYYWSRASLLFTSFATLGEQCGQEMNFVSAYCFLSTDLPGLFFLCRHL